ncbi:hypothetical protein HPP92_014845 [Vanilla planifolia]|uniref:BHLH domain-containing protein n=1 Tax=Vanilla planifolia TaxID=51239 RepID=A0A835QM96_VANPL|nr:hypothetical protein HPP92_014845 [Vanilla planifolia]
MESASIFNNGFENEDGDEEHEKEEGSLLEELTVMVNGRSSEQKASTPRSKHSVTEQRRRSKINDRLEILKRLLPNGDQKRDKASFLLEVIDYIQILQEKVHKYESIYPGWGDESNKFMPWVKVYFRSSWKNARSSHPGSGIAMTDPHTFNNGSSSPLLTSDDSIPVGTSILLGAQKPTESVLIAGASYAASEDPSGLINMVSSGPCSLQPNLQLSVERDTSVQQSLQRLIPEADNVVYQSEWLRTSIPAADCNVRKNLLDESEDLTIDESTISASTSYSQGLLNLLRQALHNSGIELSRTSISVHVNLRRRTSGSRVNALTSMATPKDLDEPMSTKLGMGRARFGSGNDESEHAAKRHKADNMTFS